MAMMRLSSYFVLLSTLVGIGNISHAYITYEQFYPAVVYLSTDKISLAIMYNFAFMLFLLFGKAVLIATIGSLRDLEVERTRSSSWSFTLRPSTTRMWGPSTRSSSSAA